MGSLSHFLYLKRHIEILPCCSNEGHFVVTCVQQKLAGVSRGCGWQHLAAWTNLVAFYIVGLPLSILFGFKLGLQTKVLFLKLCIYDICNVYPMQIRKKNQNLMLSPLIHLITACLRGCGWVRYVVSCCRTPFYSLSPSGPNGKD